MFDRPIFRGARRPAPPLSGAPGILRSLLALLIALFVAAPGARANTDSTEFDKLVKRAMQRWAVPGLAIAAVKDDKVVLMKAYGYANPDIGLPATTKTMFGVGSITKSFTATLIEMLVESGDLKLDRPVHAYLPEFRLKDQNMTKVVTLRDLLSHRSGLPRHDVLWYAGSYSRDQMVRRLRYLKPTKRPREAFQYNNLMYMTAGFLAGQVEHSTWEDLVRQRILQPLGMTSTRLSFLRFLSSRRSALGYYGKGVMRVPIAPRDTDSIGPAAAAYSTVEDMARFLQFQLDGGAVHGKHIVSADRLAEMQTPNIDVRRQGRWVELGDVAYGLGFYISSYRSHRLIYHSGFIDGYGGLLSFLPNQKMGIVVLTNLSGHNPVPKIVTYLLYDRLLGVEPIPWLDRYIVRDEARGLIVASKEKEQEKHHADLEDHGGEDEVIALGLIEPPPVPERRPKLPRRYRPAKAYEGIYDHPAYGPIQIWAEGDNLFGRFHYWIFPMKRIKKDLWEATDTVWPIREGLHIRFKPGKKGRMASLLTPIADGPTYRYKVGDIEFRRRASSKK